VSEEGRSARLVVGYRRLAALALAACVLTGILGPASAVGKSTGHIPPVPPCYKMAGPCESIFLKSTGEPITKITTSDSKGVFELSGPAPLQFTKPVGCGDLGCIYNHLNWGVGTGGQVVHGCEPNTSSCSVKVPAGTTGWIPVLVNQNDYPVALFLIYNSGEVGYKLSGRVSAVDCGCSGGRVSPPDPVSGITITASGSGGGSGTTDSKGFYSITLPKGSYTVKASGGGRTFKPKSQPVELTGNVGNVNFSTCKLISSVKGTLQRASSRMVMSAECNNSIAGSVYRIVCGTRCSHAPPIAIVKVRAAGGPSGPFTVETDKQGNYDFEKIPAGTWHVGPVVEGTTLVASPKEKTVKFEEGVSAGASGLDFAVCDRKPGAKDGCLPEFDYTMPARYLDAALDPAYANPKGYTVAFKVRNGDCDRNATYTWFAAGKELKAVQGATRCDYSVDFNKEGTYLVRAEQKASASTEEPTTFTKEVVVQDFLFAALGDSAASGEGNPPLLDEPDKTTLFRDCDQSRVAYGSQAALRAENLDPRSSVTFLELACSGALLTEDADKMVQIAAAAGGRAEQQAPKDVQAGAKEYQFYLRQAGHTGKTIFKQLDALKKLIGDRELDGLTITIGVNDLDWTGVIAACVVMDRCDKDTVISGQNVGIAAREERLVEGMPALYKALGEYMKELFPASQLKPKHVYLVGYPDPLYKNLGALCDVFTGEGPAKFEGPEVAWAERSIINPFEQAGSAAARANGWTYVSMSNAIFSPHGYCSAAPWWLGAGDAFNRRNYAATYHPNREGQIAMTEQLWNRDMEFAFFPDGKNARKP
jgi:hypothetical protein